MINLLFYIMLMLIDCREWVLYEFYIYDYIYINIELFLEKKYN